MKHTTVLHGGECHRTSIPHKSGNKMKEDKKMGNGNPVIVDCSRDKTPLEKSIPEKARFNRVGF